MLPLAAALPVAFVETGFLLLAAPLVLLMAIWAVLTAVRILRPEAPLPPVTRRRGDALVHVRQIADEQRRRPAPVVPPRVSTVDGEPDADAPARTEALAEALWARRN